jgi:hypothetical protein
VVTLSKVAVSIQTAAVGALTRDQAPAAWRGRFRGAVLPYADGLLSWAAAATSVVAMAFYVRTLMPADALWDTGEAQTVPYTLSIFHPTGFPTYTLLGWAWSQVPFGNVAWRLNLLSAVCMAISAGLVVLITGHLIDERHRAVRAVAAVAAGGAFAFAAETWTVAVRADVHALNTLFVSLIIWLLLCWRAAEWGGANRPGRWLLAAALVFGIAMGNHPLVGLMAAGILVWLFIVDSRVWRRWRLIAGCAGLLLLGLSTYLYIPFRALTPPEPPLFYAHPTTLARMRYLVFAEQFHDLFAFDDLLNVLPDKWREASRILQEQYLGPGWVIAALGAATLAVRQLGAFVFLFLIAAADVVYSMNFNDGDINRYYLPALVATAPFIGVAVAMSTGAVARAAAQASRHFTGLAGRRRVASVMGVGLLVLGMVIPSGTLVANYTRSDQSQNFDADRWVDSVYAQLPQNAVIVSWWSYSTALWYHRWVLGERPDVTIIDERNILDDGYITIDAAIRRFIGKRPVFVVPPDWEREELLATFSTDWVATVPGFTSMLRIKESGAQ